MLVTKYNNRRLYDTDQSDYVTVADLLHHVCSGKNVQVVDSPSRLDITAEVLLGGLVERERRRENYSVDPQLVMQLIRLQARRGVDEQQLKGKLRHPRLPSLVDIGYDAPPRTVRDVTYIEDDRRYYDRCEHDYTSVKKLGAVVLHGESLHVVGRSSGLDMTCQTLLQILHMHEKLRTDEFLLPVACVLELVKICFGEEPDVDRFVGVLERV